MSRLFFLIIRSFRNIFKKPASSLGSFLSLLLLFLLFDLVWIASLSTTNYYSHMVNGIDVEAFLNDGLPDSSVATVQEAISKMDGVGRVEYISKDDARIRLYDLMGSDLLEGLDDNPLPRSLVITFKEDYLSSRRLEEFQTNLKQLPGIAEIFYARSWLDRAEVGKAVTTRIIYFLGGLILLATIFNLVHSIRLSVYTFRKELVQWRLLGASRAFLMFPYVAEAVIYSLTASAAAWALANYGLRYISFKELQIVFPSLVGVAYFLLAAMAAGLVGGYLGSRRSV